MTTNTNTNRPVFDAGKALAAQDAKDTSARLTIFRAMQDAGANAVSLGKDGEHFADLRDGYLVAWQGQAFADAFAVANGKVELKGKVLNAQTGAKETVTMPRVKWQQALGSKVSKARDSYLSWLGIEDSRNMEEPEGATKQGATKAGQGAARNLNTRVYVEIAKLEKAVKTDRDAGKNGSDKTPEWAGSYDEVLVAFSRILGMIDKKFHPTK
jgi:hypothetical protein